MGHAFDAKGHPSVKDGRKTEKQVLDEFLRTFEVAYAIKHNSKPDGVISEAEFFEYYNCISATIEEDSYFN